MEERFVRAVILNLGPNAGGFFLQTKLRGGVEHAANALFRQMSQRRLATSRTREWDIGAKRFRQDRGIDPNLRNVTVRFGPTEKFAVTFVDENVEHSFFERGVNGVTVQIPIPVDEIDLDAAA